MKSQDIIEFVKSMSRRGNSIGLHEPCFDSSANSYINDCIASGYVSSVGKYVDEFEERLRRYTGSTKVVATVNGTAALHASLELCGVSAGDLVITQPLTFVATCNAIRYAGADPLFCDVSESGLGLSSESVRKFLHLHGQIRNNTCFDRRSGRVIRAILPMHTFGHPVDLDEFTEICSEWKLSLIEDAAEGMGSRYKKRALGTFGRFGAVSFNGNKIITTGGGGAIFCRSSEDGDRAKHITTTAKKASGVDYFHDALGFNYRMPNINAALGVSQLIGLDELINKKRRLAVEYKSFFFNTRYQFVDEPEYGKSNFWLNAILCSTQEERDSVITLSNKQGVNTRPAWVLMHHLPMYKHSPRCDSLMICEQIASRLVNLPSSAYLADGLTE